MLRRWKRYVLTSFFNPTYSYFSFFQFLAYAQTLRSELQYQVRSNAAILLAEFDGVTKEDCAEATDPDARATNLLFRRLLAYNAIPTSTRPQYPGLCPIISRDNDEFPFGTENIVKVYLFSFLLSMLMILKFLVIILFGKSQTRTEIPERHKGCNADNWGIIEVTPNMVAFAATMVCALYIKLSLLTFPDPLPRLP
jgi:hypothetical protein